MKKGITKKTVLKNYDIGNAGILYQNLQAEDSAVHIIVPIFNAISVHPINYNFIFSTDMINNTNGYGAGFRPSYYKTISYSLTKITITDAFGAEYVYERQVVPTKTIYYNDETNLTVERKEIENKICYVITDEEGNEMIYQQGKTYPWKINNKNGTT